MIKHVQKLTIMMLLAFIVMGGAITIYAEVPDAGVDGTAVMEATAPDTGSAGTQTQAAVPEERPAGTETDDTDPVTDPATEIKVGGVDKLKLEASSPTSVFLSWKRAEGAEKYEVYRKIRGGEYELKKTVRVTSCRMTIKKDQSYRFKVVPIADSASGNVAAGKAASCPFTNKLAASAAGTDKRTVRLSWKKVSGAEYYTIYHRQGGAWIKICSTKKLKKNLTLQLYGVNEYYRIKAFDRSGSEVGILGSMKVCMPRPASGLHTTVTSPTKVSLGWSASAGANCYKIYMKTGKGTYKYRKTAKKPQAELAIKKNTDYRFKVVPVFSGTAGKINGKPAVCSLSSRNVVSMDHQKYSYSEMVSDIRGLARKYHDYVTYRSVGKSWQGREIYDVVLGNPDAKNTVLVVSTIHAREYAATVICMKQLEYYLQNYNKTVDGKKPSKVFQNCNVHYVMMANPDGVVISQTKNSRWKANGRGVNLNYNFPYDFRVWGSVRDNSYSGAGAASEKETQAIISLTKHLNKKADLSVVNYHAMGNIVFGGYGGRNRTLGAKINQMYRTARNTTGYSDASGYSGASYGNYRDYLMFSLGIPSITIEVGSVPCPLPQSSYASIFERNKLVLLREAALM